MPPRYWPRSFEYSRESVSTEMNKDFLRLLLASDNPDDYHKVSDAIEKKTVHSHLKIILLTEHKLPNKDHPLCGLKSPRRHMERGVFAKDVIKKGSVLGEYVGQIRLFSQTEAPEQIFNGIGVSEYAWVSNIKDYYYYVESKKVANELAFINDYRGIQDSPNAEPGWIVHRGFFYFVYLASRDISAKEELLVDYGNNYWKYQKIQIKK